MSISFATEILKTNGTYKVIIAFTNKEPQLERASFILMVSWRLLVSSPIFTENYDEARCSQSSHNFPKS